MIKWKNDLIFSALRRQNSKFVDCNEFTLLNYRLPTTHSNPFSCWDDAVSNADRTRFMTPHLLCIVLANHSRSWPWCASGRRPLPWPLQVQNPERAVYLSWGRLHWTVRVLRQEGYVETWSKRAVFYYANRIIESYFECTRIGPPSG